MRVFLIGLLCSGFALGMEKCVSKIVEAGMKNPNELESPRQIRDLLILVAMEVEERAILKQVDHEEVLISALFGITAKKATVGKHNVWILRSGVGAVNAALATALFMEKVSPDAILLMGVGGALSPDLNMGDIVIARHLVQHDSIFTGENGIELMAPGELFVSLAPHERRAARFAANPVLNIWVKNMLGDSTSVREGTILSGAEFAATATRKQELAGRDPEALLVEMEAAGVAQVALKAGIPFLTVKTVADRLNPDQGVASDYSNFLEAASDHAAQVAHGVLETFRRP